MSRVLCILVRVDAFPSSIDVVAFYIFAIERLRARACCHEENYMENCNSGTDCG